MTERVARAHDDRREALLTKIELKCFKKIVLFKLENLHYEPPPVQDGFVIKYKNIWIEPKNLKNINRSSYNF